MIIALAGLAIVLALVLGVGPVSHGVLRHLVQTAPLWPAIVLDFRRSELAKWCALPALFFWSAIMICIWLFLLGWARIVTGTFTPVEIAMTIVCGIAAAAGMMSALRKRTATRPGTAAALFVLFSALQLIAFRISLLPGISHD
ncbi:MAG TPA: hypothetical protein VI356_16710 [Myxococcales bacterium]